MNTDYNSNAATTRNNPAPFSTEIEGEGMELALRGFLMACLLSALVICNLHLGVNHHAQPSADRQAEVAVVKPAIAPVVAPVANL